MVEAKIDRNNFTLNGAYKASGLVERITVALQTLLRPFGLSGRDLLRVIMGFGCNVPAAIGTNTSANLDGCVPQAGRLLPCPVTALTIAREQSVRFAVGLMDRLAIAAIAFSMLLAWGGNWL